MKRTFALLTAVLLSSTAYAKTFTIDGGHSNVAFTVRHLVGKVTGQFTKFDGSFDYDPKDAKTWKTSAVIDVTSVNTGNTKRDDHLKTPDFFDTAKFPSMTFKSTGLTDVKGNMAKLHGDLTLHGVTKPVVLDLELSGPIKDPFGSGERAGATATGKINRKDFGIVNKMDASGMIGEDVTIVINVEGFSK